MILSHRISFFLLAIIAIEILLLVLGQGYRQSAVFYFSFAPLDLTRPYKEVFFLQKYLMFISYGFIHSNVIHLLINVIALYLLGNILKKLGKDNLTFSILFFSTLGGASFYYLFEPTSPVPMIGANCASFGLLAFVLSEELINRLRRRRSVNQMIKKNLLRKKNNDIFVTDLILGNTEIQMSKIVGFTFLHDLLIIACLMHTSPD